MGAAKTRYGIKLYLGEVGLDVGVAVAEVGREQPWVEYAEGTHVVLEKGRGRSGEERGRGQRRRRGEGGAVKTVVTEIGGYRRRLHGHTHRYLEEKHAVRLEGAQLQQCLGRNEEDRVRVDQHHDVE